MITTLQDVMADVKFTNTRYFRQAALTFLRTGKYTDAPYNSYAYTHFWDEEDRRCRNGYQVGDLWIPGRMYFMLNYCPMSALPNKDYREIHPKAPLNRKVRTFPDFWDVHFKWWKLGELSFYRASIGERLCHKVALKTRRAGFSYIEAADGAYNYNFIPNSISVYYAAIQRYLRAGLGIFGKVKDILDHLNAHTDWKKSRSVDTKDHIKSGFYDSSSQATLGYHSEIITQVIDSPEKTRGGDVIKATFEEGGSFPNLIEAWTVAQPQLEQSGIVTGIMTAFGTGSSNANDKYPEGLQELFYNPESYGIIGFPNIWDIDEEDSVCGYFAPAWSTLQQCMDDDGNIDKDRALSVIHSLRNPEAANYKLKVVENPLTPDEAINKPSNSAFSPELKKLAKRQLYRLEVSPAVSSKGFFIDNNGTVFSPQPLTPFEDYPIPRGTHTDSCINIWEHPSPNTTYLIVHDPYAYDTAPTSTSIGAAYVINLDTQTFSASWVGRPAFKADYNDQLFHLIKYYGAKLAFYLRGGGGEIITYARQNKLLHLLHYTPIIQSAKEVMSESNRAYGINLTTDMAKSYYSQFADWLSHIVGYNDNNQPICRLETITDKGLLKEIRRHTFEGDRNYDRLDACAMIPTMIQEWLSKKNKKPVDETKLIRPIKTRGTLSTKLSYLKHY